jgi:hypothetical protein
MLLPFLVWVDFDSRMKQTDSEKATSYRLTSFSPLARVLVQGIFHHLVDAFALLLSSPFQFLCQ